MAMRFAMATMTLRAQIAIGIEMVHVETIQIHAESARVIPRDSHSACGHLKYIIARSSWHKAEWLRLAERRCDRPIRKYITRIRRHNREEIIP